MDVKEGCAQLKHQVIAAIVLQEWSLFNSKEAERKKVCERDWYAFLPFFHPLQSCHPVHKTDKKTACK